MPELPDIVVYIEALEKRILGERLDRVRIASPFLLRTATPPVRDAEGKTVVQLRRLGKRICIALDNDIWLVLHLMIAGRLHWRKRDAKVSPPRGLAAFDFANGTLLWTEAGSQKRASLHVVTGEDGLSALDPGGLGSIREDPRRLAVPLLKRRAGAQGMDQVIGHIHTLQSAPHPRPLQRVRRRDLNIAGPGLVTQLPRVTRHAPDSMPRSEQLRHQPSADVARCPGDKASQWGWPGPAWR